MPAGRSAVAQCPFCCDPRLEEVSLGGRINEGERFDGWVARATTSAPFDPLDPESWGYWGVLFSTFSQNNTYDGKYGTCGDCASGSGPTTPRYTFASYVGSVSYSAWNTGTTNFVYAETADSGSGSCVLPTPTSFYTTPFGFPPNCSLIPTGCTYSESPTSGRLSINRCVTSSLNPDYREIIEELHEISGSAIPTPTSGGTPTESRCSISPANTISMDPTALKNISDFTEGYVILDEYITGEVNFRLEGAASTDYVVTLVLENSIIGGATLDPESVEIEVTTDTDGIAEFTYTIPQPPANRSRCYNGEYTITPA